LIHDKIAIAEEAAVEHFDRFQRFLLGGHLDEPEAPGAPGELVRDDAHGLHVAGLGEDLAKILLGGLKGEVSDKELSRHRRDLLPSWSGAPRDTACAMATESSYRRSRMSRCELSLSR